MLLILVDAVFIPSPNLPRSLASPWLIAPYCIACFRRCNVIPSPSSVTETKACGDREGPFFDSMSIHTLPAFAAIELSKYNIRVNTVHPDCVYDTDVWSHKILKARAKQYGLSVSEYKHRNLLKTDVSSADVAELVAFFASAKSSKTTGAQIPIDGGNDRII